MYFNKCIQFCFFFFYFFKYNNKTFFMRKHKNKKHIDQHGYAQDTPGSLPAWCSLLALPGASNLIIICQQKFPQSILFSSPVPMDTHGSRAWSDGGRNVLFGLHITFCYSLLHWMPLSMIASLNMFNGMWAAKEQEIALQKHKKLSPVKFGLVFKVIHKGYIML